MKDMNLSDLEVGYDVPALPGMDEADIQTPCLVLDLDALERNIKKMGDFCSSCQFHPTKTCPISSMHWAYFERHKASFKGNHRLAMTLRTLEKRDPEKKRKDAETFAWVSTTLADGQSLHEQTRF